MIRPTFRVGVMTRRGRECVSAETMRDSTMTKVCVSGGRPANARDSRSVAMTPDKPTIGLSVIFERHRYREHKSPMVGGYCTCGLFGQTRGQSHDSWAKHIEDAIAPLLEAHAAAAAKEMRERCASYMESLEEFRDIANLRALPLPGADTGDPDDDTPMMVIVPGADALERVRLEARIELAARITDYLAGGGLFNPEMALHNKVRELLIDCREALCGSAGSADTQTFAASQAQSTAETASPSDGVTLLSKPKRSCVLKKSDFASPEAWEKYLDEIVNAPEPNVWVLDDGTCKPLAAPDALKPAAPKDSR